MPHPIDFQEIENKLFLLLQLTYSSKAYIADTEIARKEDDSHGLSTDWINYAGGLASIVGDYSVECAAKTRVAQDYIAKYDSQDKLDRISDEVVSLIEFGQYRSGGSVSSVRESCNKIIHATEARLNWVTDDRNDLEYWDGTYCLSEEHRGDVWNLDLDMRAWSQAMKLYHRHLKNRVDWFDIWEVVFQ